MDCLAGCTYSSDSFDAQTDFPLDLVAKLCCIYLKKKKLILIFLQRLQNFIFNLRGN